MSVPPFAATVRVGGATVVITLTPDGQALEVCPVTPHLVTIKPTYGGEVGCYLVPVALTEDGTPGVDCARNQNP